MRAIADAIGNLMSTQCMRRKCPINCHKCQSSVENVSNCLVFFDSAVHSPQSAYNYDDFEIG